MLYYHHYSPFLFLIVFVLIIALLPRWGHMQPYANYGYYPAGGLGIILIILLLLLLL